MPFVACHHCGRPVVDTARFCAHCGGVLAPEAPGRGAPAAGLRPPGTVMRAAQGIAIAACTFVQWIFAPNIGTAIFIVLLLLGLGMLFLGWSRKTRRYIPFAALGFTLVFLLGVGAQAADRAELDEQVAGLRAAAPWDSTAAASPDSLAPTPPPRGVDAKKVWVMRRLAEDGPAYLQTIRERHGVHSAEPLDATLTPRYTADAGSHPEVGRYWEAHAAALAEIRQRYPGWAEARMVELAGEADLPRQYIAGMREGFRERAGEELEMFTAMEELGAAGLAYHRSLVSVDARVNYEAERDAAVFDSDAERTRTRELRERFNTAVAAVERVQRESFQKAVESAQSSPGSSRP
jgi:hypothetical protein